MYPVLFDLHLGSLGQFTIGTYGLFYALGFLLALRLAVTYARREGIETARIVDLGIVTLLAGFVGAKLLLYLLDLRYYLEHPIEMVRSLRSAGVFYGGFVGATLAAVIYIRRHRLPLARVTDLAAPPLALGQAVGRLGCFAAGCCYGRTCDLPWAVTFTDPRAFELTGVTLGIPLHPTQIYHALADLVILGITVRLMARRRYPGQVFWVYVLLYAIARVVVEAFRGDAVRGLFFGGMVSTSQIIAVPAAILAGVMLYLLPRRAAGAAARARG
ncbi:MAG TPA: prolipoprotein diacylglyceryl transferase [Candidatus Polarisedimenticolia bacterium]|nr:prolipoprotein diacylglyceryl transferase [Candidatus Polarisedimenticolia bacterium]